jgi:hypothetical protein
MKPYNRIKKESEKIFKRNTGISKENFLYLAEKISQEIEKEKEEKPIKKRGLKKTKISQEDRLLLVLYYFLNLGNIFDISESYCCKIYRRYAHLLSKIERLQNRKEREEQPYETLIIDVSEQPIERPIQNQYDYYSGKKKDTRSKFS